MNFNSSFSNPSFGGRREDLKNIKSLSENNIPILPNKKNLILSAINNVGQTADKKDIEMLMGTVETMKYGIKNNSEFAKALGGANGEKENTDWDNILQGTIRNAINGQSEEDKAELEARFQKIFGEEKPLSEEEKTMLQLRSDILSSKEMTDVLSDAEKTTEAARVTQNLDYFIASSEINTDDKIKCLGMMKHFLSDDYEINPQLKDYKVQAFSEMVNDLIVERPDEKEYTIKDVSQKQTGMCAAISIARKTISYEDKVRAMEIMMNELDATPTMKVYDRTAIGTGKMVEIPKAHVDFTDGMQKGYRIVDTGTHQWMNAANVVGDGSISTAHYQAFDPDNYEIFRDAKWYNDMPQEFKPAQNWLRYLNKEKEAVGKASGRNDNIAKVQKEIGQYKKDYELEAQKSDAAIRSTITSLDSSVSEQKAVALTRQILKADKLENPEFKVTKSDTKEIRQAKIAAFLKSELPNVSEDLINANIEKISGLRDLSNSANGKLDKLKSHSTPQAIFAYNKNLFTAAAHHRRSVQAELNVPERLSAYEKELNVPSRAGLVQDAANKVLNNLSSQALIEKTAKNFDVDANADSVKLAVEKAVTTSEVAIPTQIDNILEKMGMGDRITVVSSFLDTAAEQIKSGNNDMLEAYAENAHIKPDTAQVLKKIETVKASLQDNPSNKQIQEAVNLLGYNNQIEMTADLYKTFTTAVEGGALTSEQAVALLGQYPTKTIANMGKEIKALNDKQINIETQLGLPTRQEVVLNVLEATGEVVSEKTLQDMQAKFDKVAEVKAENDNRIVDPSVKKPKIPDSVYKFTPAEKALYAQIESKLPSMKEYASVNAKEMNKALEPQLDALFAETGRLAGHLWVGGEGESGLYDNQSIKVLELITGKHYYNEEDIDKVVAHIKKGEGSGTSSTNVSHTEYSGHAQYVAEVSQVAVIDPQTKETVMKDVLWHDNTWGKCEGQNVWTDEKGVKRTDYGNGYGGPDGYVFDERLFTGTFVDDQKVYVGKTKDGQKFDLWKATRIAGENPKADKNINEVLDSILKLGNAESAISELENTFKQSAPVNFDLMDQTIDAMTSAENRYIEKIEKAEPQTQVALDAIKDDNLKFLLEKTALQMSTSSEGVKNYIQGIIDPVDLERAKSDLPQIQRKMIASTFLKGTEAPRTVFATAQEDILNAINTVYANETDIDVAGLQQTIAGIANVPTDKLDGSINNLKQTMVENSKEQIAANIKDKAKVAQLSQSISEIITSTIDNKLTINTVEDLKNNSEMADTIIELIDNKFNTSSEADLQAGIQKLQNMTNKEFEAFIADTTSAELGLKTVTALDVARQINAQKSVATDAFKQNSRLQVLNTESPLTNEAPEWQYRELQMKLQPVQNTIDIAKMKPQLLNMGMRAAFPNAEILTNEEINDQSAALLSSIETSVENIKTSANKREAAAELNQQIREYVSANIAEKYQDKTKGLLNAYVTAVKNGSAKSEEIANATAEIIEQGHITKHPDEMIKTFIKEVQAKNQNEEKLATLREYMTTAYQLSEYANVEYSLISNAESGIETMMNNAFGEHSLYSTVDGSPIALDSDDGIDFLVNQLANPANNSTALQVFFAHTGLSERAVDVISKSINLEAIPEISEQLSTELSNMLTEINNLNGDFAEFAENQSVSYSSYKDAVQHFVKTMDKKMAEEGQADSQIYTAYKSIIEKTQNADFAKNLSSEQIMPILAKINDVAIQNLQKSTLQNAEQLNELSYTLTNKLSAMEALKVPENSESEKTRVDFVQKGNDIYVQLVETINKINEMIA